MYTLERLTTVITVSSVSMSVHCIFVIGNYCIYTVCLCVVVIVVVAAVAVAAVVVAVTGILVFVI